jgi:hypothetical protein
LAGEQLLYAGSIQTDSVNLGVRYDAAHAGRAYTGFVGSQADSGSCRTGTKQVSSAHVTALLAEFTRADNRKHGLVLRIDPQTVSTGTGSGEIRTHYFVDDPSSPFYLGEIHVKAFYNDRVSPDYGRPLITRDSTTGDGTWYTFHAGSGTANVWWRGGGPYHTINCKLHDDIVVRVRPGF